MRPRVLGQRKDIVVSTLLTACHTILNEASLAMHEVAIATHLVTWERELAPRVEWATRPCQPPILR